MDCLFCKIARKEIPAEVVYETDAAVAVLDIHPIAPGHTMVLPTTHARDILNLPEGDIAGVFLTVKRTTAILGNTLLPWKKAPQGQKPDGFTIGINHGSVSGATVEHLHIHIIPRFVGDGGSSLHAVVRNVPLESLASIRDRMRKSVGHDASA